MRAIFIALAAVLLAACETEQGYQEVSTMKLQSPAFGHGERIPSKYTCDGEDLIPPLIFSDVPMNAQSLALVVDDPDTPRGTWDHWVLWNMDPKMVGIKEAQAPRAAFGTNSFRRTTWGGPCPPDREHRYFFRLYALDTRLSLPEGSTKADLEHAIKSHVVAQAELMGTYERK